MLRAWIAAHVHPILYLPLALCSHTRPLQSVGKMNIKKKSLIYIELTCSAPTTKDVQMRVR